MARKRKMSTQEAFLAKAHRNFAEGLLEQIQAKRIRESEIGQDRSRRKKMKESILHPFSDPEGRYQKAKRIAGGAAIGGTIGHAASKIPGVKKFVGKGTGAAVGAGIGHVLNKLPHYAKETERAAHHLGSIAHSAHTVSGHSSEIGQHVGQAAGGAAGGVKQGFKKGYHGG